NSALLLEGKESHVREASGLVSRSRRRDARQVALLGSRGPDELRKRKLPNQEFRAEALSRRKRRNLCKERLAGHRELNRRALQARPPASREVRDFKRAKRKALA
ncbi:MAG TPA: hypothetical protein VFO46_05495, partial [Candidatus Sulfotelmatobacter sp.]|nr:hypothetical protein [Candidatus Sulfotelmatobacter sp.]